MFITVTNNFFLFKCCCLDEFWRWNYWAKGYEDFYDSLKLLTNYFLKTYTSVHSTAPVQRCVFVLPFLFDRQGRQVPLFFLKSSYSFCVTSSSVLEWKKECIFLFVWITCLLLGHLFSDVLMVFLLICMSSYERILFNHFSYLLLLF